MRLLSTMLFLFTVFSNPAVAENKSSWLELNIGGGGEKFLGYKASIKNGTLESNWAVEFTQYDDFRILSHAVDQANNKILDPQVTTIAVTKNWISTKRLGYFEAGVGLGVACGLLRRFALRAACSTTSTILFATAALCF